MNRRVAEAVTLAQLSSGHGVGELHIKRIEIQAVLVPEPEQRD